MYIYQRNEWPRFRWETEKISDLLGSIRHEQGRLIGRLESMGFELRQEASLSTLTNDVLKTSEIEGLKLDPEQVRSSLAKRLGIDIGGLKRSERDVDGIVEMLLDATQNYLKPLTEQRLFGWHAALFPTGYSGLVKIKTGNWRDDHAGNMQVTSGPVGREKVHFVAPPAASLQKEMENFLSWFETTNITDSVIKSGLAHLWFVTIHPFDDGNGRIARAIADMTLARGEKIAQRFYSMSGQIRNDRNDYYDILESTQKGSLDVTEWLLWYLECLERAVKAALITQESVLKKAHFWVALKSTHINERQHKILNKILDGFEGKLTSSKWAKLGKCSQDTAHRDIMDLIERGILKRDQAGGRSTTYSIAEVELNQE